MFIIGQQHQLELKILRMQKKQLGIKETKNLVLDCKTRWNSTYLMLSTALLYKDVFDHLKECERNYTYLPSESE